MAALPQNAGDTEGLRTACKKSNVTYWLSNCLFEMEVDRLLKHPRLLPPARSPAAGLLRIRGCFRLPAGLRAFLGPLHGGQLLRGGVASAYQSASTTSWQGINS